MGQKPPSDLAAKKRARQISALKKAKAAGKNVEGKRGTINLGKTNTKILLGDEDVSMWSDEELKQGKRFDKNGGRRGVAPKVVPKAIHDELVRRTLAQSNEMLRENLTVAVEALTKIVSSSMTEDKDKIKAIGMIMDRVMGKTPEKIDVKSETPPWQIALNAGIVSVKGTLLEQNDSDDDSDDDEEDE